MIKPRDRILWIAQGKFLNIENHSGMSTSIQYYCM